MENTKKNTVKKVLDIVLNTVLWLFVIFAVVITVITVSASSNKKNVPSVGGNCYLSILSDSMNAQKPSWVEQSKPSGFKTGDLIIGKYIAENEEEINKLEKGDIITFEWDINGDGTISAGETNTHRIVNIVREDGKIISVETQGDNEEYSKGKTEQVSVSRIIAKYTGRKIGGVGKILASLSKPLGFGLCIVLPLVLFFAYELFVFIKTVMSVKNEGKKLITAEDEELIRQRAVEEYLRRQQEEKEKDKNNPSDSE